MRCGLLSSQESYWDTLGLYQSWARCDPYGDSKSYSLLIIIQTSALNIKVRSSAQILSRDLGEEFSSLC